MSEEFELYELDDVLKPTCYDDTIIDEFEATDCDNLYAMPA